jgi:hypothetical protein
MLRVEPQQGVRLAEIITSLHERIREATERGWLGEIEGLQVSLDAARQEDGTDPPDPPPRNTA